MSVVKKTKTKSTKRKSPENKISDTQDQDADVKEECLQSSAKNPTLVNKTSPREVFVQACGRNEGLVIKIVNNIFANSAYIHSSSHVCWDGMDPLWSEDLYAKQWTLQPWDVEKRNNKSLGLPIPIEVQRELQALMTMKHTEKVMDRYTNTTLTTKDHFGLTYQFSIVDDPCITCFVTGPSKQQMYYLDTRHVYNIDWHNTELVLRRVK